MKREHIIKETAKERISRGQLFWLFGILFFLTVAFFINWHLTIVIVVAGIVILYFIDLLFSLFLIVQSLKESSAITITKKEIEERSNWPTYTILCPLYKEWAIIPQFVKAIAQLDYPKYRLKVMLLLEENDARSQEEVKKIPLPDNFHVIVTPASFPTTKPKACN